MNNSLFKENDMSISVFANLSGISRKNLIYYDRIDVLKPMRVDENGYRYYSYDQLNEVSILLTLKELGVPLNEIKRYLSDISADHLVRLIEHQKSKIMDSLNRLSQMNDIIEHRAADATALHNIQCDEVSIEYCELQTLFMGSSFIFDQDTVDNEFEKFLNYSQAQRIVYGYPLGIYTDCEALFSDVWHCNFFYSVSKDLPLIETTIRPAGHYAITYDRSYLGGDMSAFYKICEYLQIHNLQATGTVYVENIVDELTAKNDSSFVSRISVRIKNL